jgi:putative membrane-bound dehydrogenase-like protein
MMMDYILDLSFGNRGAFACAVPRMNLNAVHRGTSQAKALPWVVLLILTLVSNTASAAEPKTSNAPFLSPAEAVAKMDIPDGFDVSIFAAEPDIAEPIAFCFDDRGRIWVVENINYVNRRTHTLGEVSRIKILEDTDGDGVFDKKKIFMDDITFASGIAVGFGGVYIGSPPNLSFIPDADGDDVPDGPAQVLLDGWGIDDRHETLNSFIWGPDGWLYGCHGVFTNSNVGKPGASDEDRQYIDAGIWRYHPTKHEFEVFARGLSNPWGFDFNDQGQGFATCCVIPHLFHVSQGGVYDKQSKAHVNPFIYDDIKTIRDHTHKSAHGGARFYLADTFPAEYRDRLFMCNIHQHEVLTDVMTRSGSGYIGSHGDDFMPINDLAWVGFSVEIGPEGGVYILDWHDTDICGNAINFPNSGRIYRILPENAPKIAQPNLRELSDLELVEMQMHSNDWYVRHARTILQERAASGDLDKYSVHEKIVEQFMDAPNSGKRLRMIWAAWVTDFFGGSEGVNRFNYLLDHEDEYCRAWAIQLLGENRDFSVDTLSRFKQMAENDSSPVVRLYLASALQRMEFEDRWPVLEALASREEDREDANIPRMLWFALEPMVPDNADRALMLAINSGASNLQEFVPRRMLGAEEIVKPNVNALIRKVAPGFRFKSGESIEILESFRNEVALQTHPVSERRSAQMYRNFSVPAGKKTTLKIRASYHPHGDWQMRVVVGRKVLLEQEVSYATVQDEWLESEVDLTAYAGTMVEIVLENVATGWNNEFGFWGKVELVSE